ncbi:MAG: acyltransferase [Caloramator sp.]|nr:acyltransferase [Caloramator sp.]
MKSFFKGLLYLWVVVKIGILRIRAKISGDYIINRYIEHCDEREIKIILKILGAKIENSSNIRPGLVLDNTYFNYKNLIIEDNCFIGRKVFFDMADCITIKKDAVLSEGVSILTHQDVGNRMMNKYYKRKVAPVILEEGCWIGANATILCGVRIGKCSVVAAGSVVNRDVPDYTVVGGVPAKFIKELK